MRTTIELPDPLVARARKLARQRGVPLKTLVEEGLRKLLDEQGGRPRFVLKDASFKGDGLADGLVDGDWERIRELSYEGRGT